MERFLVFFLLLGAMAWSGCNTALAPTTATPLPLPTVAPVPSSTASATMSLTLPTAPPKLTVILRASPMPITPSPGLPALIEQARADLAARRGVPMTSIVVKTAQTVEWPDASLGCPQPGIMYAQVITPGVLIVLTANSKEYEYHGSLTRVMLCEKQ